MKRLSCVLLAVGFFLSIAAAETKCLELTMLMNADKQSVDTQVPIRVPFIECKGTLSNWTTTVESDEDKTFRAYLAALKDNKAEELKNLIEISDKFKITDYQKFRDQFHKMFFPTDVEIAVIGKIPAENGVGYLLHKPDPKKSRFVILAVGQTPNGMRLKVADETYRLQFVQAVISARTLEELQSSLKVQDTPKLSDATFPVTISPADDAIKAEIEQTIARAKETQFKEAFTAESQAAFNKAMEKAPDNQKQQALDQLAKGSREFTHTAAVGPFILTYPGGPMEKLRYYYRDNGKLLITNSNRHDEQLQFWLARFEKQK